MFPFDIRIKYGKVTMNNGSASISRPYSLFYTGPRVNFYGLQLKLDKTAPCGVMIYSLGTAGDDNSFKLNPGEGLFVPGSYRPTDRVALRVSVDDIVESGSTNFNVWCMFIENGEELPPG